MKTKTILKLSIIAIIFSTFSCHGYKSNQLYSLEECRNFKKGDTILTREFYTIERCVVIENIKEHDLIEYRPLDERSSRIVNYENFRFK